MDFILSLAHFCEIHGPTSILSTQISPFTCSTCPPCHTPPASYDVPPPPPQSTGPTSVHRSAPQSLCLSSALRGEHSSAARNGAGLSSLSSPLDTPAGSPRSTETGVTGGTNNPYFPSLTEPSLLRRSQSLESDANDTCGNCSFLVPAEVAASIPSGAPGSSASDGRPRQNGPVLRTQRAVLAYGTPSTGSTSDTSSDSASSSFSERQTNSTSTLASSQVSTPGTSPLQTHAFAPPKTHTHTLTYLTTSQPTSAGAYSRLRRTCIRTLSCENLPSGSPSGIIYFGDHVVGYTIAYLFRIPDPRARGRRRTYALMALGGQDSCRVSRAFVHIAEVFESISRKIIAQAEKVLGKEDVARQQQVQRTPTSVSSSPQLSSSYGSSAAVVSPVKSVYEDVFTSGASATGALASPSSDAPFIDNDPTPRPIIGGGSSLGNSSTLKMRDLTPVSSFLSAKQLDPDGYPRVSREPLRTRSLADLVGQDNFFVELHAAFSMLLSDLLRDLAY